VLRELSLRAIDDDSTLRVALHEREIRKSLKRERQRDVDVHHVGAREHVEIPLTGGGQIALQTMATTWNRCSGVSRSLRRC
jgi:hypothetical protein